MMERLRYYPCPKAVRALLCETAAEISLSIVLCQRSACVKRYLGLETMKTDAILLVNQL